MSLSAPKKPEHKISAQIFACGLILCASGSALAADPAGSKKKPGEPTPESTETKPKPGTPEKNPKLLKEKILYAHSTERRAAIRRVQTLPVSDREQFFSILIGIITDDPDPAVREAAISAIGEMKVRAAEDALIRALDDERRENQMAAAAAIGRLESAKACGPAAELLKKQDFKATNLLISALLTTLGRQRYRVDIPFLQEKLASSKTEADNRLGIIRYFGAARIAETEPELVKIFENEDEDVNLRSAAAGSLGLLNGPKSAPALRGLLEKLRGNKNPRERARLSRVKLAALNALIRLGDKSVEGELLASARDDDPNVRLRAIKQIGELRLQAARELLTYKSTFDESKKVKKAAKVALLRLDGKQGDAEAGEEEDVEDRDDAKDTKK